MSDLISRQQAVDALADMHCKSDEDGYVWIIRSDAWARIDALPSVTPKQKTGKWNFIGNQMFECSECGTCYTQSQFYQMRVRISDTEFPKFCPNCGARMTEEDV